MEQKTQRAPGLREFLKEAWEERKDVSWPSQAEVLNLTLVVIATTLIVSAFLGAVDLMLSRIVTFLITTGS